MPKHRFIIGYEYVEEHEVDAESEDEAYERALAWASQGPHSAEVIDYHVELEEPADEES